MSVVRRTYACAVVDPTSLCILTCVVRRTHACVVVDPVHTGGIVFTVVVLTVVGVDLTPLSLKAQRAGAALGMNV